MRRSVAGIALGGLLLSGAACHPTQTIVARELDSTAPYLSTIPDAILLLDYFAGEAELERTIRILKMRGSAHSTAPRRLLIGQGGLSVEPARDGRYGVHGVAARRHLGAAPVSARDGGD